MGGEQQWRDLSRWYDAYLTVDRVARYLGGAEGSLAADFFAAKPDHGRRYSLSEILHFVHERGGGGEYRVCFRFPMSAGQRGYCTPATF